MKTSLLSLCFLLSLVACKKDDTDPNGLPKAIQEGKNTAGFLLNGEVWLPERNLSRPGTSPIGANWSARISQGGRALQVILTRHPNADDYTALNLIFSDVRKLGTFELNQDIDPAVISGPRPPYAVYSIYEPGPDRKFYSSAAARGQVIISRFDTVARVVAGTFEVKVQEDGGAETLDITQGRFDLTF